MFPTALTCARSLVVLAAATVQTETPAAAAAAAPSAAQPVFVFGIPVDFILFGLTLIGVAIFHHKTLQVALAGLAVIVVYKLAFTGFKFGPGLGGLGLHLPSTQLTLGGVS